jgi:hypothetical protein
MASRVIPDLEYEDISEEPVPMILISKTSDDVMVESTDLDLETAVNLVHEVYLVLIHELFATWEPAIHYLDPTKGGPE